MSVFEFSVGGAYELVGEAATYHLANGQALPVRAIEIQHADEALSGLELPMRGHLLAYRVRKSELENRPRSGDSLTIDGVCRSVLDGRSLNRLEWLAYVND